MKGDGGIAETMEPEPPFEVEDVRDEPGGYDFEIGLGDEIILVRALSWSTDALQTWISRRV